MKLVKVKILRPFYCSLPGGNGRDMKPGDEAGIPASLVDTLSADGYVEALESVGEPKAVEEVEPPKEEPKPAPAAPVQPQSLAAAPRLAQKAPLTLSAAPRAK